MKKRSLPLIAFCAALLLVGTVYAQSEEGSPDTHSVKFKATSMEVVSSQSAEGCAPLLKPQRFPATGQTSSYVAGDDGDIRAGAPLRYRDNGDGTITDQNTNLMWEKKDQASGDVHNWDNTYPWQGTCSNSTITVCGTDVDCSSGGTCSVSGGGTTIFQWVAQLDTPPCFAGHCDWRIPNIKELQSIVDYETYLPPVDSAFNNNCAAGCTIDGADNTTQCSCTESAGPSKGYYWSGSTYAPSPIVQPPSSMLAWGVLFGDGDVLSAGKTDHDYVRAVRCGVVRPHVR